MTTQNPFLWENYQQFPPEVQKRMLEEIKALLPHLTRKQQADTFENAPAEVILEFLPLVSWEAQVKIYRDYLPVGASEKAWSLLHWQAENKLKYRPRSMKVLA